MCGFTSYFKIFHLSCEIIIAFLYLCMNVLKTFIDKRKLRLFLVRMTRSMKSMIYLMSLMTCSRTIITDHHRYITHTKFFLTNILECRVRCRLSENGYKFPCKDTNVHSFVVLELINDRIGSVIAFLHSL